MSGLEVEINSYVDNIALAIFDGDGIIDMGDHEGGGGDRRDTARAREGRNYCIWKEGKKGGKGKMAGGHTGQRGTVSRASDGKTL